MDVVWMQLNAVTDTTTDSHKLVYFCYLNKAG